MSLLAYEATRNPAIKALVDRAADLSDEEIDTAAVPLPWYRKALKIAREKARKNAGLMAQTERVLNSTSFGEVADPVGEVYEWRDERTFIRMDRSELEITTGDLIFIDAGGVWIGSARSTKIDPRLTLAAHIGTMTRSQFSAAVRARTNTMTPVDHSAQERPLFRIIRN